MNREQLVRVLQRTVDCVAVKRPPQETLKFVWLTTVPGLAVGLRLRCLILQDPPKENCPLGQTHNISSLEVNS